MTAFFSLGTWRSARPVIAGVMVLAAVQGASASDDAGLHQFFSAIFGGASQPDAEPAPSAAIAPFEPRIQRDRSRPLTVRLHRAKPRIVASQGPFKPVKVSIFEDRTLRRGDAVMTANGIRVFAGSSNWPYQADDFVTLDDARQLNRDTTRVLAQLDKMPRG